MLPLPLVEEINRLLQEGKLSQRKIAAKLGVSRGTVGAISSGKRGLFGKEARPDEIDPLVPLAPPERCGRCGFMVYMPCLICRAIEYRARRAALEAAGVDMTNRPQPARSKPRLTAAVRPCGVVPRQSARLASRLVSRARRARVA